MNVETVDTFIDSLNFGKELKFAEAIATDRLDFLRRDECNVKGHEPIDIASAVLSEILADPVKTLKPSDLNQRNFRALIKGKINNAVKLILSKETRVTVSYNYNETLSDEAFYDQIIQTPSTAEAELNNKLAITEYFDRVEEMLLEKPERQDAWLILGELRDGKKPREIAEANRWQINKVYNEIRNIHRMAIQVKKPELHPL